MVGVEGRLSVELPLPIADALRRWRFRKIRCRYLQREQRNVEHCCAQRRWMVSRSVVAAESRIGDIRGWLWCVVILFWGCIFCVVCCMRLKRGEYGWG